MKEQPFNLTEIFLINKNHRSESNTINLLIHNELESRRAKKITILPQE